MLTHSRWDSQRAFDSQEVTWESIPASPWNVLRLGDAELPTLNSTFFSMMCFKPVFFLLNPWAPNDYYLSNYHLIHLLWMPSVHAPSLTFNSNLSKTELRLHSCSAWNLYHRQLNPWAESWHLLQPHGNLASSVIFGVEPHQRLFEYPSFGCPVTVLYSCAYQHIQRVFNYGTHFTWHVNTVFVNRVEAHPYYEQRSSRRERERKRKGSRENI